MNIICLDIDDCIFNSHSTYAGYIEDDLEVLEINLKRIVKIIKKWDFKIFITSSWYLILKLENNNLKYLNESNYLQNKPYYQKEYEAFKLLSKYLNGHVIGLSCGNREEDIINLLKENHKVIAFDDMDLSFEMLDVDKSIEINYKFVQLKGFITNDKTYEINKFLQDKTK